MLAGTNTQHTMLPMNPAVPFSNILMLDSQAEMQAIATSCGEGIQLSYSDFVNVFQVNLPETHSLHIQLLEILGLTKWQVPSQVLNKIRIRQQNVCHDNVLWDKGGIYYLMGRAVLHGAVSYHSGIYIRYKQHVICTRYYKLKQYRTDTKYCNFVEIF